MHGQTVKVTNRLMDQLTCRLDAFCKGHLHKNKHQSEIAAEEITFP